MITFDMAKAKELAHEIRRQKRSAEFEPYDLRIAAQIPGTDFTELEAQRQLIRDKYDATQVQIDSAIDMEQIKLAIAAMEL